MKSRLLSITLLAWLFVMSLSLSSCQSRENRVINGLERLADRVDRHGADYNEQQWEEVFNDYEQLHNQAERCDFTQSQLERLSRVEGRLTAVIAKEGSKELGREIGNIIKNGESIVNEFMEGLEEGLDESSDN